MSTLAYLLPASADHHEILIGLLWDDRVLGIEERSNALVVFYLKDGSEPQPSDVKELAGNRLSGDISVEEIQDRNWNEEWEKTIAPIATGGFYIRPSWNTEGVPEGLKEIIIDPKMSFGTGYHESTRLMLGGISDLVSAGDQVLDAGTGTGVLAFAALLMGAEHALAFDIDPICKENADENAVLNGVADRIEVLVGTETVMQRPNNENDHAFDIVLANINREALRAMLPALAKCMKQTGKIGLAGLLVSDRALMTAELEKLQLMVIREATEGDWWSVWASR